MDGKFSDVIKWTTSQGVEVGEYLKSTLPTPYDVLAKPSRILYFKEIFQNIPNSQTPYITCRFVAQE